MTLSNAERQRRWRERQKARIRKLEVLTADLGKVSRPNGTWDERDLKAQPQEIRKLYQIIDSMMICGDMAELATATLHVEGIANNHIAYAASVLAMAEHQLRELRAKIVLSPKETRKSGSYSTVGMG